MDGVDFNEEPLFSSSSPVTATSSASWLVRKKFAKSEKEAVVIQVALVALCVLVMGGVWLSIGLKKHSSAPVNPAQTVIPGPGGQPVGKQSL